MGRVLVGVVLLAASVSAGAQEDSAKVNAYINDFTPGLQNAYIGAFGRPFGKFECSATYHY